MEALNKDGQDWCDNVLLEWELSLALMDIDEFALSIMCPVLTGGAPGDNLPFIAFDVSHLEKLSDKPSIATGDRFKEMMLELCRDIDKPSSMEKVNSIISEVQKRSIRDTVRLIIDSPASKDLSTYGSSEVEAINACAQNIFNLAKKEYEVYLGEFDDEEY
jgi:hypothetical protein